MKSFIGILSVLFSFLAWILIIVSFSISIWFAASVLTNGPIDLTLAFYATVISVGSALGSGLFYWLHRQMEKCR